MELPDRPQSSLGSTYEVRRELGGGGMSRVFVAWERALGREVVVKLLPPELAAELDADRFRREIQVAARLQHPCIVPVLTAGEMDGLPYYVMPFVQGESLRDRLSRGPRASIGEAVAILRDVAKALAYAHERGLVHRDVKPENVLLSGGVAVVTDFGIAKAIDAARGTGDGTAPTLTQAGTSLGTPAYMAPEQAAADPDTDHRADLYAFGMMAYELFAGAHPFHGRSLQRLLAAQMSERPRPLPEVRSDVPPTIAALIMQCVEKDAANRPGSASEIVLALEAMSTTAGGAAPRPTLRRSIAQGLLGWSAATMAVGAVAWVAMQAIGLPDWTFTGAVGVMLLGLPVVLLTALAQRASGHRSPTPSNGSRSGGRVRRLVGALHPHLSWKRATLGGAFAIGALAIAVGGYMTLRAMGIGSVGSLSAAGIIEERDRVVVTDFRGSGTDTIIADVAAEAIRTDLGQSRLVSVLAPATVAEALRAMRRDPSAPIDLELAREIALREGAKAVVDGDVTPFAGGYIVRLRLVSADSARELAGFRESVSDQKELLGALDALSRRLRAKMGESLREVRATPSIERVTTASLPALQRYVAGSRALSLGDDETAVEHLKGAVALDSGFAMAQRLLGIAYFNIRRRPSPEQDSALARAFRHADRLTERERYHTTAAYFANGPGRDRTKAIAAYESWLRIDSLDVRANNNLAVWLVDRREWRRAAAALRRIPDAPALHQRNLLTALISLGELDEAGEVLEAMRRRFPGSPATIGGEYFYFDARGWRDSAERQLARMRESNAAGTRAEGLQWSMGLALRHGRLAEAERLSRQVAIDRAARGLPVMPVNDSLLMTVAVESWFRGRPERVVPQLDAALAAVRLDTFPESRGTYFRAVESYSMAGRPDRARAILARYDAEIRDTTRRRFERPYRESAEGFLLLAEGKGVESAEMFRRADRREDGPTDECDICTDAMMARAFDRAGMKDSVIASLERFLTRPNWWRIFWDVDPLFRGQAYRRLGELYAERGDLRRAIDNYTRFVDLWKDADPELQPSVRDARARLATLVEAERRGR